MTRILKSGLATVLFWMAVPLIMQAATRYDGDGTLSGRLEELRWLINRARYAPEMEADRLSLTNSTTGGHPDYDCCEDTDGTNDFGSTSVQWAEWKKSRPPWAPNARLSASASNHSLDMASVGVTNGFMHNSPTNTHYPTGSTPDQRMTNELYYYSAVGENIAAGTDWWFTPETAHGNLFVDDGILNRGHRQNLIDYEFDFREVGLGYATNGGVGFYTEDFGRSGAVHFVTDTIFFDANSDMAYTEGEGVSNIEVRLFSGSTEAAYYDNSTASGSFAVPVSDLPDGATITVVLVNRSGSGCSVSIPLGYYSIGDLYLTNNESHVLGTYVQPNSATNIGFRNVAIVFSNTAMVASGNMANVTFTTLNRANYTVKWTTNLSDGVWSFLTNVTASGYTTTVTDTNVHAIRFYRVFLQRDS